MENISLFFQDMVIEPWVSFINFQGFSFDICFGLLSTKQVFSLISTGSKKGLLYKSKVGHINHNP